MPRNTYLRPPNDDYAPNNNIQLGHVWTNPQDPGSFISAPIKIPEDIKINQSFKGPWTIDLSRGSSGNIGLWAKIMGFISASGRLQWERTQDGAYEAIRLETVSIEPTAEYVAESVKSVSPKLLGDNLYMVTGIKIVRGGEGSNKKSKNFDINIEASADTTMASVPDVGAGSQVRYSKATHNNQHFGSTDDFVFAYRMREIFYKKGVLKSREYNKGTVLGEDFGCFDKEEKFEFVLEDPEIGNVDIKIGGMIYSIDDGYGEECDVVDWH